MPQAGDSGVTLSLVLRYPAAAGSPAGTLGDPIPLEGATASEIKIQRPDGSQVTPSTVVASPATDGKLTAVTNSTTFSLAGLYRIQGAVTLASGADLHSSIATFRVGANL